MWLFKLKNTLAFKDSGGDVNVNAGESAIIFPVFFSPALIVFLT